MADKAKLLKVAQKHLSKGALDKAIKTFEQLVGVDPGDQRLILRLADIQARAGRKKEAVENYEKVAAGYMRQDFTPKAIAVYKTILRLDPELLSAYEKLAELYKNQGLEAEALSQFENLFQVYERKNDEDRQIEVLKLMADLDPENLGFQVRLGETLAKRGHKKEAAEAFAKAASTLSRRGFHDRASQLFEKIVALNPDNTAVRKELCAHYLESGHFSEARTEIEAILAIEPDDPRMVLLLGRILFQLGDKTEGEAKIGQSIRLFIDAGELESVMREFLFVAQSHLRNGEIDEAEAFYRQMYTYVPDEVRAIKGLVSVAETRKDRVAHIENLLLLARTMHQGGDREGADSAYRKVSELDPLNEEAGDYLAAAGPSDTTGEMTEIEPLSLEDTGPGAGLEEIEDVASLGDPDEEPAEPGIDDLDEGVEIVAVEEPETFEPGEAEPEPAGMVHDHLPGADPGEGEVPDIILEDFEEEGLELQATVESPEVFLEEPAASHGTGSPPTAEGDSSEKELSLEELLAEADVYQRYGLAEKAAESLERARARAPEDQLVLDRIAAFEAASAAASVPPADSDPYGSPEEPFAGTPDPAAGQDPYAEDLEEADFYHSQGLDEEALRIYRSILQRDPGHKRASDAIAAIEDGDAAREAVSAGVPSPTAEAPLPDAESAEVLEGKPAFEAPAEPIPDRDPVPEGESTPDAAVETPVADMPASPAAKGPDTRFDSDPAGTIRGKLIVEDSTPEDMGDFLDIADDLRIELAEEVEMQSPSAAADGPVSFEDIFSQFKKGIEETLGDEEYETHYNLGIAYKDMGLYEDAVREFRSGARDPALAQDSYSLMAMCYTEQKDYQSAVKAIEMAMEVSNAEGRTGLLYQLGVVREKQKKWPEAVEAYEQVLEDDPSFEGIAEAIERVKSSIADAMTDDETADRDGGGGMDDMLTDLIREVEEMARESTGETQDDPDRSKKDRISYL